MQMPIDIPSPDSQTASILQSNRRVVTLEMPQSWFADPEDGHQHRLFYTSVLSALAQLKVLIDPVWLPRGAERASRSKGDANFTISFHSYGPASDDVVRFKESYIFPYYVMDPMGYACFSHLAAYPDLYRKSIEQQSADRATRFVHDLALDLIRSNRSKYLQPQVGQGIDAPYLFMPLQVENDSVSRGSWVDMPKAVSTVVNTASHLGLKTVIKRHPRCRSDKVSRFLAKLGQNDNVILSTDSIHSLIAGASLVVGANSGVLFEALIHGRPVVSYGCSDFAIATHQARDCDALARAIADPDIPDRIWRNKFLFWYLTEYCVRADDPLCIRRRLEQVMNQSTSKFGLINPRPSYIRNLYIQSLIDRVIRRIF